MDGGHTIECTDVILQSWTLELYLMLLTKMISKYLFFLNNKIQGNLKLKNKEHLGC